MIKGAQATPSVGLSPVKYVGLTNVEVRAINPTRAELNKLLGKEDSDTDTEISYLTQDQEGTNRVRLTFWLYDPKLDKYFVHSFNLTNKIRLSKDESKTQYINNTCGTGWAEEEKDLQDWFKHFTDQSKQVIGDKIYRKALLGEEELATFLRSWLGRMKWYDTDTSVLIDTEKLFKEDYTELRGIIDSGFDTPFVIMTGVKTDASDTEKQYQQVYGKSFLPSSFMSYINKGIFPTEYSQRIWNRFSEEINGDYGFQAYFELCPIKEYSKDDDIAAAPFTMGADDGTATY